SGGNPSYGAPNPDSSEFPAGVCHLFKGNRIDQGKGRHENHHISKYEGVKTRKVIGLEHQEHQNRTQKMQYTQNFFRIEIFVSNKTSYKGCYNGSKRLGRKCCGDLGARSIKVIPQKSAQSHKP